MNVIETHGLGKSYGATKALHDCNLGDPRRARGRAGRAERCRKVDVAEPRGRTGNADER